jgi:hypothetical protein
MDAARGPSPSLGAAHRPTHDTLSQPGKQLGQSRQRSRPPAALVVGNTAGSLAGGGFA